MADEGEFILNELFKTQLAEAKRAASLAWKDDIYDCLAARSIYDIDVIEQEFVRRVMKDDAATLDIVDEFVTENLEGSLCMQFPGA